MTKRKTVIIIAGTPGVGKTTVGKTLAKLLDGDFIDLPEFVRTNRMYEYYDRSSRSYIVKMTKVEKMMTEYIKHLKKEKVIIASHLIPKIKGRGYDVKVITLRLNPLYLIRRLRRRQYSKKKLAENVEAEFLGIVHNEATETYGRSKVTQVDITGLPFKEASRKVIDYLHNNLSDDVDWLVTLSNEDVNKLLRILSAK